MTDDSAARPVRTIAVETEVAGTPEEAWNALTDPAQISRWFPLAAEVEPGVGGKVWLSWGPGVEGTAPIHIWDRPARFGWTENYGEDDQGRPVEVAVDFHVETRDGATIVRLVQSGISASADWDEMYDALTDGWTYFLFNLSYYMDKHPGEERHMVWVRPESTRSRKAVWNRLVNGPLVSSSGAGPGGRFDLHMAGGQVGQVVSVRPGYHFAGVLPGMNDSILFIELEGKHVGIWLSTYGGNEEDALVLQKELEARTAGLLG